MGSKYCGGILNLTIGIVFRRKLFKSHLHINTYYFMKIYIKYLFKRLSSNKFRTMFILLVHKIFNIIICMYQF